MAKPRDRLADIMHRRFKALRKIDRIDHQLRERASGSPGIPQSDREPKLATPRLANERRILFEKFEQEKKQALKYAVECPAEMSLGWYVPLQMINASDAAASAQLERLLEDVQNRGAGLATKEGRKAPSRVTIAQFAQPKPSDPRELLIKSLKRLIDLHRRYTKSSAG